MPKRTPKRTARKAGEEEEEEEDHDESFLLALEVRTPLKKARPEGGESPARVGVAAAAVAPSPASQSSTATLSQTGQSEGGGVPFRLLDSSSSSPSREGAVLAMSDESDDDDDEDVAAGTTTVLTVDGQAPISNSLHRMKNPDDPSLVLWGRTARSKPYWPVRVIQSRLDLGVGSLERRVLDSLKELLAKGYEDDFNVIHPKPGGKVVAYIRDDDRNWDLDWMPDEELVPWGSKTQPMEDKEILYKIKRSREWSGWSKLYQPAKDLAQRIYDDAVKRRVESEALREAEIQREREAMGEIEAKVERAAEIQTEINHVNERREKEVSPPIEPERLVLAPGSEIEYFVMGNIISRSRVIEVCSDGRILLQDGFPLSDEYAHVRFLGENTRYHLLREFRREVGVELDESGKRVKTDAEALVSAAVEASRKTGKDFNERFFSRVFTGASSSSSPVIDTDEVSNTASTTHPHTPVSLPGRGRARREPRSGPSSSSSSSSDAAIPSSSAASTVTARSPAPTAVTPSSTRKRGKPSDPVSVKRV